MPRCTQGWAPTWRAAVEQQGEAGGQAKARQEAHGSWGGMSTRMRARPAGRRACHQQKARNGSRQDGGPLGHRQSPGGKREKEREGGGGGGARPLLPLSLSLRLSLPQSSSVQSEFSGTESQSEVSHGLGQRARWWPPRPFLPPKPAGPHTSLHGHLMAWDGWARPGEVRTRGEACGLGSFLLVRLL